MRRSAIIFAALLPFAFAVAGARAVAKPCSSVADYHFVPGQGNACRDGALWKIRLNDGTTVESHGPDVVPGVAGQTPETPRIPRGPTCVPSTSKHGLMIYAVASDHADEYDSWVPQLREDFAAVNGLLHDEALQFGRDAVYRMACSAPGIVRIDHVVLPTHDASSSFGTIVGDLSAMGYNKSVEKYWIYYDGDAPCNCSGQGSIRIDDSLSASNANNGGPSWAVTYGDTAGPLSHRRLTMMHEDGHNMGAVQLSSPHASGGLHCNDGLDIMCYADGGSKSQYVPVFCPETEHYDCGHDDYFNPSPLPMSYLSTHWNVGSPLNAYLSSFDLTTAPGAPIAFTAAAGPRPRSALLQWRLPPVVLNGPLASFRVYRISLLLAHVNPVRAEISPAPDGSGIYSFVDDLDGGDAAGPWAYWVTASNGTHEGFESNQAVFYAT